MKLIIDRNSWLRGEGYSVSRLIRPFDGKMCCLGFLGLACGIDRQSLLDKETPCNVERKLWPAKVSFLFQNHQTLVTGDEALDRSFMQTSVCTDLMKANDGGFETESEREEEITKLFAANGIEVEFIN